MQLGQGREINRINQPNRRANWRFDRDRSLPPTLASAPEFPPWVMPVDTPATMACGWKSETTDGSARAPMASSHIRFGWRPGFDKNIVLRSSRRCAIGVRFSPGFTYHAAGGPHCAPREDFLDQTSGGRRPPHPWRLPGSPTPPRHGPHDPSPGISRCAATGRLSGPWNQLRPGTIDRLMHPMNLHWRNTVIYASFG